MSVKHCLFTPDHFFPMPINAFSQSIENASPQQLQEALQFLLKPHAAPVFGAAKTVEHEIAGLQALKVLGVIRPAADEFDLVESLRVAKTKARSLIYHAALRAESSQASIDAALRHALVSTRVVRDGELYLVEIPDPLTMDRLRKRVRDLGFLSDGKFSGALAKIPEGALLRLVADLIPAVQKEEIHKQLLEAGLPDKSVGGLVKAALQKAGRKVADETGEQVAKAVGEVILTIFCNSWEVLGVFCKSGKHNAD